MLTAPFLSNLPCKDRPMWGTWRRCDCGGKWDGNWDKSGQCPYPMKGTVSLPSMPGMTTGSMPQPPNKVPASAGDSNVKMGRFNASSSGT